MKNISILYLTDNNYAAYAGISIVSLFEENKHFDSIKVYVIDDNIAQDNKDKMVSVANSYTTESAKREIIFLDVSKGIEKLKELGAPKYRNSYTTYLKLFAFGMIPESDERVFFIDSDTVIVGKLDGILGFDMKGNVLAAVKDVLCRDYMVALGFDKNDSWYNMGVVLVDLKKWNSENCEQKIIDQLKIRAGYVAVDQDLLNITQHGRITTIPCNFNATAHHYVYKHKSVMKAFPQHDFYTEEEIEDSKKNPVIHHFERFVGQQPWIKNNVHPYKEDYFKYKAISPWKDIEQITKKYTFTFKVEILLYKILPKSWFVRIYAIMFKRYFLKENERLISSKDYQIK